MKDPTSILSESFFPTAFTKCLFCRALLTKRQYVVHDCKPKLRAKRGARTRRRKLVLLNRSVYER